MKNFKLIINGLINSLGVLIYVSAVSWLLFSGEKIFGKASSFLMPAALLLLFVLSAAITGSLVLGKPALLYFENQKSEAIKLLFYTIGWLFIITVIVMGGLALFK
jgi:hypothetical protein